MNQLSLAEKYLPLLQAKKRALRGRLGSHIDPVVAQGDIVDQAVSEQDRQLEVGMQGQGAEMLERVLEAIQRIQDRTYGCCVECGRRIPAARLKAKPESDTCVECQGASERAVVTA